MDKFRSVRRGYTGKPKCDHTTGKSGNRHKKKNAPSENKSSSPVCYIGTGRFREGFEDMNIKS